MNAQQREQWLTAARAEAARRWGWPARTKIGRGEEMMPTDWLKEGKASGFVAGAMWAIDRLDQEQQQ